ncbi:MAG: ABC transporter permease, partial [Calditrichia bacterium]|nr:ABC transporter permease [Calditrichia bacterium]
FPEIENVTRLQKIELPIKNFRNTYLKKKMLIADPSVFEVMKYRLELGDEKTALQKPKSLVLNKENALKYLGTENVIGKSITMEWNGKPEDFLVTGILEKIPQNSHITFDMIISISSYPIESLSKWFENPFYTYIKLKNSASRETLEAKFPAFQTKYMTANFSAYFGPDEDINKVFQIKLRPLLSIHLNPSRHFEIEPQGSESTVFIFSIIAIMILIIACINFMNLSTARGNKRAKEVGMRKTIGATKHQLWVQFLGESFLYAFMALFIAIILIELSIPVFNTISGKTFSASSPFMGLNIVKLIGITLASGLLSGVYPAFYLTSFKPISVLKNNIFPGSKKSIFRTVTAIFQFVISIGLIIATIVVYMQLQYIQNKTLGFNKENVVVISAESSDIGKKIQTFKNILKKDSHIISVSASSNDIGNPIYYDTNFKRDDNEGIYNLLLLNIDYDFL